jgi:biopolymer transport protein ExbD
VISLTPLIDVVFILLVFFMLASNFLQWQAIRLEAPARAGTQGGITGTVLVRIGAEGGLDIGGAPVTRDALAERLRPMLAREPEPTVLIQPAPGVPLQRAVDVLDAVSAAGADEARLFRGSP